MGIVMRRGLLVAAVVLLLVWTARGDTGAEVYVVNLNGDAWEDVLTYNATRETIVWFPGVGPGVWTTEGLSVDDKAGDVVSLLAADVNNDGATDILGAGTADNGTLCILFYYPNRDNSAFGPRRVILRKASVAPQPQLDPHNFFSSIAAWDVDSDGLTDIVSRGLTAAARKVWYRQHSDGSFHFAGNLPTPRPKVIADPPPRPARPGTAPDSIPRAHTDHSPRHPGALPFANDHGLRQIKQNEFTSQGARLTLTCGLVGVVVGFTMLVNCVSVMGSSSSSSRKRR